MHLSLRLVHKHVSRKCTVHTLICISSVVTTAYVPAGIFIAPRTYLRLYASSRFIYLSCFALFRRVFFLSPVRWIPNWTRLRWRATYELIEGGWSFNGAERKIAGRKLDSTRADLIENKCLHGTYYANSVDLLKIYYYARLFLTNMPKSHVREVLKLQKADRAGYQKLLRQRAKKKVF